MSTAFLVFVGPAAFPFAPLADAFAFNEAALAARADTGPVSYPPALVAQQPVHPGGAEVTFGFDFYERVHYSFLVADLGNLVSEQVRTLYVWNAFRRAERLIAIAPSNAEGIAFAGAALPPFVYPPTFEAAYTFTVSLEGPAEILASYFFDWESADATVRITGSRITGWAWQPDWSAGIVERMEWATDVLQAYNGSEQRRALRIGPRKAYEFDAFFIGRDRRIVEAAIWGWGARTWALPIWPDGQALTSPVASGSTQILAETATRDFGVGGLVMLIASPTSFETVEVQQVLSDRVVLARPLTGTWPAGTMLYPARPARIADRAALPRWSGSEAAARMVFELNSPVDATADGGATTYRGRPVLTRRPNWAGGLEPELRRKLAELDGITGRRVYEDEAGIPITTQRMRWTLVSRAEIEEVRRLAYALRGRHGSAWLPTWTDDLIVSATIGNTATAIDVENIGYTRQINVATGRRDLRIETVSGSVFYRRVLTATQIDAATERLTIDSALGVTLQPADILQVSFMMLGRMAGDQVEIAYWTGDTADVAMAMQGFQHAL